MAGIYSIAAELRVCRQLCTVHAEKQLWGAIADPAEVEMFLPDDEGEAPEYEEIRPPFPRSWRDLPMLSREELPPMVVGEKDFVLLGDQESMQTYQRIAPLALRFLTRVASETAEQLTHCNLLLLFKYIISNSFNIDHVSPASLWGLAVHSLLAEADQLSGSLIQGWERVDRGNNLGTIDQESTSFGGSKKSGNLRELQPKKRTETIVPTVFSASIIALDLLEDLRTTLGSLGCPIAAVPIKLPQSRLKAHLGDVRPFLTLDGNVYQPDDPFLVKFIAALIDANGGRVTFAEFRKGQPGYEQELSTRWKKRIPKDILQFIESKSGSGFRIKIEELK